MTTINSSSPTSVWVPPQTNAPESTKLSTQPENNASTESVLVKISDAALAKLNAEVSSNEPPAEAASSGSGNDPPVNPPVTPQSSGSGNDFPIKT